MINFDDFIDRVTRIINPKRLTEDATFVEKGQQAVTKEFKLITSDKIIKVELSKSPSFYKGDENAECVFICFDNNVEKIVFIYLELKSEFSFNNFK